MTTTLRRAALVLGLAALAAPAQTTWIVDAANGAGTNFTDLPPAAAAAAHGDLLVVRPGTYTGFTTSKGIAVLGQGTVKIAGPTLKVTGLPAGRTFSMRNVEPLEAPLATPWTAVLLENNLGRVHLHAIRAGPFRNAWVLVSSNSVEVTITASTLDGGLLSTDSTLVVSGSRLDGRDARGSGIDRAFSSPAIFATGGSLSLAKTGVFGGWGALPVPLPPSPALRATGTAITLTGDASTRVEAGLINDATPAIQADGGTLDVDPNVVVLGSNGGPPISGTVSVTTRRIVSLTATGGRLGGPVSALIQSPAGDLVSLLLSLPIDPIPTPLGTVYFDPLLAIGVVIAATQNPTEQFPVNFTFPALPALRGVGVVLQAANFYRATSFLELSNPVVLVLDN